MILRLHPEAEDELFHDAAWYDSQRPLLGDDFLAHIARWFDTVLEAPHVWPQWPALSVLFDPPIRRVVVDRFPYAIAYQLHADHVLILAVAHSSREPGYWVHRLRQ